jgi:tetratricopeptide (TPR) repeat protein
MFVGRERELDELRGGLDAAFAGHGAFILIAGEPGIGKTSLANELGREAAMRGARVLRGANFEGGGAPAFWPWVQIVRSAHTDPASARAATEATGQGRQVPLELRDLLPPSSPNDGVEPDLARFRLFDAVASILRAQCAIQPLVIVLDDLQWADESSLLLLQFLGRDVADTRMMLLGMYRSDEVHRSPEIGQRIAALACDARAVALGGLTSPEVAGFIAAATQQAVPEEVASAVHGATGGNPLFVDELVRSLRADGRLDESIVASRLPLPQRVHAVIRRRTDDLSDGCRRVLAVAASIGRDFDLATVAHACAVPVDGALRAIDEARDAHVVCGSGGRFAFVHDLFREAFYEDIPPDERRRLHEAVGGALERLYAPDVELHLPELAHHFLHADPGSEKAIRYSLRAAERAAGQLAYERAVAHCQAALEALSAAVTPDAARRCETLLVLGENLWKTSDFDRARQVHLEAAELAEALGLPEMQGRAALGFGGHEVSWDRSNNEPALVQLLERALAAIGPGDTVLRAAVMARLGTALAFSAGDRVRGEALGRGAVAMARRLGDQQTLQFTLSCCICAVWGPDSLEERLAIGTELAQLSRDTGAPPSLSLVPHLEEAGDLAAARRIAELHDQETQGTRQYLTTTWILTVWRAMTAHTQGRFDDAERLSLQAFQLRQGASSSNAVQYFGSQLLVLRREQGRLAEIVDGLGGFSSDNPSPIWRLALAWVHAELDRTAEAARAMEQLAAEDSTDIPRDMYWLMCLWLLAEIVAKLGDRRRAESLYAQLLPYRARCALVPMSFNGGSLERSLGLLAGTAGRHEEAAAHFEAALVVNQRIGARPWVAHTEHEYARLLVARGRATDRARAVELLHCAVEAAKALGMTALLARAEPRLAELVASGEEEVLFRRGGEYWTVAYEGVTSRVRDARGLRLISILLCAPGRDIPATHLAVWPEAPPAPGTNGRELARELGLGTPCADDDGQPDGRARAEYRARLVALREEADEAERYNDTLRASRAREEIAALAEYLGRPETRVRARKDAERARLAVTKAIRYAIRKVERAHRPLGTILAASVKTGVYCRYDPDPRRRIRWVL